MTMCYISIQGAFNLYMAQQDWYYFEKVPVATIGFFFTVSLTVCCRTVASLRL